MPSSTVHIPFRWTVTQEALPQQPLIYRITRYYAIVIQDNYAIHKLYLKVMPIKFGKESKCKLLFHQLAE